MMRLTDLAAFAGQHEIRLDIFLADLFGHRQTERSVAVVDRLLGLIALHRVCVVDLLKLRCTATTRH